MTIALYNLSFKKAKEILSLLDKEFGLVYSNDFCAHGNTISAIIHKDEDYFKVEIQSNYFTEDTVMKCLEEHNDEYFLKKSS